MNARIMAFVYRREHEEWRTLEDALKIVSDPDTKQGIIKEIDKRRQNVNKIGKRLEQFDDDVEEEKVTFMLGDRVIVESRPQQVELNIRTGEICTMCKKGVMCKTSGDSNSKWCDNCHTGVIGEMKKP